MNLSSKPHASRYPWESWFEKGKFDLRKGVDYLCQTGTMISNARNRASKLGLSIAVLPWKTGDGITVIIRSRRAESEVDTSQASAGREEVGVPGGGSRSKRRAGGVRA